jgi:hypothetical protein
MKLGEIMYILNAIVKQLYVLGNHKVFIFVIEIISGRKAVTKKRGIENPLFISMLFRDRII